MLVLGGVCGVAAAAVMSMMKWRANLSCTKWMDALLFGGNTVLTGAASQECGATNPPSWSCRHVMVVYLFCRWGLGRGCAIAVVRWNFYSIKSDLNFFFLFFLPPRSRLTPRKSLYGILVSDILTTLSARRGDCYQRPPTHLFINIAPEVDGTVFLDAPRNDYHATVVVALWCPHCQGVTDSLEPRLFEDGARKKVARKLATNSINLKFMVTDCCYNNLIMFTFKGDSAKMASSGS